MTFYFLKPLLFGFHFDVLEVMVLIRFFKILIILRTLNNSRYYFDRNF